MKRAGWVAAVALLAGAAGWVGAARGAADEWKVGQEVLGPYVAGGSRAELLARCKAALASGDAGGYQEEFESLVAGLEDEPGPPAGYEKAVELRSGEEAIRAWVYDLREARSNFPQEPAMARLIAAGPAAMDALIGSLDDITPTRAEVKAGLGLTAILRRQDLALACIERIAGCTFYRPTSGRGTHLYNDKERASVVANVRAWWKEAKGKSQAEGLRIQLRLRKENGTLSGTDGDEVELLWHLAQLEGPEGVMGDLRGKLAEEKDWLNSALADHVMEVEPQTVLRGVFERFWAKQERDGEDVWLLRYGDRKIYEEMGRRAEETGDLGPGSWSRGEEAVTAAQIGKGWALPMVAVVLRNTKMTGSRSGGTIKEAQAFSPADEAAEVFQELTGKDFGYRREGAEADRLAAIGRAADWWANGGKQAMAEKMAEEHPAATAGTDMLDSEEETLAKVAAVSQADDAKARAAVAGLPKIYAWQVQAALLERLKREPVAAERRAILGKIGRVVLWQGPALGEIFEHDADAGVREDAGEMLLAVVDKGREWWYRMETREAALAAVRRVVADDNAPAGVRMKGVRILMRWDSFEDEGLLRKVSAEEGFSKDQPLKDYVAEVDRRNAAIAKEGLLK